MVIVMLHMCSPSLYSSVYRGSFGRQDGWSLAQVSFKGRTFFLSWRVLEYGNFSEVGLLTGGYLPIPPARSCFRGGTRHFSGGASINIQKFALAQWLPIGPRREIRRIFCLNLAVSRGKRSEQSLFLAPCLHSLPSLQMHPGPAENSNEKGGSALTGRRSPSLELHVSRAQLVLVQNPWGAKKALWQP